MKTDKNFSPISPGETRDLAFDYRHDTFELDPAETLASAVFTLAVDATVPGATVDASPATRLSGAAAIAANEEDTAAMAAVQRVTGMLDGNTYLVTCMAVTSRGQHLELFSKIKCEIAT